MLVTVASVMVSLALMVTALAVIVREVAAHWPRIVAAFDAGGREVPAISRPALRTAPVTAVYRREPPRLRYAA